MEALNEAYIRNPIPRKIQNKGGFLAPHTPPGESRPYLERAAKALGVKDKDCAVMFMSQLPVASYKFSPENEALINGAVAAVSEINPETGESCWQYRWFLSHPDYAPDGKGDFEESDSGSGR